MHTYTKKINNAKVRSSEHKASMHSLDVVFLDLSFYANARALHTCAIFIAQPAWTKFDTAAESDDMWDCNRFCQVEER